MKNYIITVAVEVQARSIKYAYEVLGEAIQDALASQTDSKELSKALVDTTVMDVEETQEGEDEV